ncbi:MAG: type II toxin-antitoxin system RelE/ParE family toxin [Bifidobacteriaceae bacterium]|nr:type II toxin-antitoxin system RelE/ParE family toxin [Bifidobacteriaceae bacterium]
MRLIPARVHPEAKAELRSVRDYYRSIRLELAVRVLDDHNAALWYVRSFPQVGAPIFDSYRHVVLPRFPYMIVYQPFENVVHVLAVFHLKRDPAWMECQLAGRTFSDEIRSA